MPRLHVVGSLLRAHGAFPASRATAGTSVLLFLGISGPKPQGAEDAEVGWDPSSPFPPCLGAAGRAHVASEPVTAQLCHRSAGSVGSQVRGLPASGFLPWSTYVP